jgi:hypothetical protein
MAAESSAFHPLLVLERWAAAQHVVDILRIGCSLCLARPTFLAPWRQHDSIHNLKCESRRSPFLNRGGVLRRSSTSLLAMSVSSTWS